MTRNLILGALAFAAVFAGAQQLEMVRRDVERYDKLSTMSGGPTLAQRLITTLLNAMGQFGSEREKQAKDFIETALGDVIRYARIKGM
jgi:hypothetical protein